MNRSNVGNQVTNAIQILSVAGVTARGLGKADSTLNNLQSASSPPRYDKAKGMKEQVGKQQEAGGGSPENAGSTVENEIAEREVYREPDSISNMYEYNSEQIENIQTKINRDIEFQKMRKGKIKEVSPVKELLLKEGGKYYADARY